MKKANATLATCFGFFLLCALSMGNRMYLLISAIIALAWVFSLASVRMAEKSVKVENVLSGAKVNRGEVVSMEISVSHRSLLPIAPVALHMRATSNTPAGTIHLTQLGRRRQRVVHKFAADHVGAMFPGVESYEVSDVFGFFKRELIVKQFEEPALPVALVMLDTSPPQLAEGMPEDQSAFLKDALLETAASVVACQIRQDNPVRMPLVGDRPMEYSSRMGLPVLLDELARCTFNETERFERVLMMQLAELRKTGAVVIITTRLTSALVDMIARMKRMGPNVRLYLVTFAADNPETLPLVAKLQHAGVEVDYVTPQGA